MDLQQEHLRAGVGSGGQGPALSDPSPSPCCPCPGSNPSPSPTVAPSLSSSSSFSFISCVLLLDISLLRYSSNSVTPCSESFYGSCCSQGQVSPLIRCRVCHHHLAGPALQAPSSTFLLQSPHVSQTASRHQAFVSYVWNANPDPLIPVFHISASLSLPQLGLFLITSKMGFLSQSSLCLQLEASVGLK